MRIEIEKLKRTTTPPHVSEKNEAYSEWKEGVHVNRRSTSGDRRKKESDTLFASHGVPKRRWSHGRRWSD